METTVNNNFRSKENATDFVRRQLRSQFPGLKISVRQNPTDAAQRMAYHHATGVVYVTIPKQSGLWNDVLAHFKSLNVAMHGDRKMDICLSFGDN